MLLLIEVADSSLPFDQDVKLPIYARAGISEVWIVDLDGGRVERYTNATPDGYAQSVSQGRGATLAAATLPLLVIQVEEALGLPA